MRRTALAIAILLICGTHGALQAHATGTLPSIEIYFSPKGGCTEAVVRELSNAKTSIIVQAYSFTSAPIAKALVDARKRGVQVAVILDKSQKTEKYSEADFLVHMGIPTRIDAAHAIAHNKIMVIDGGVVITGSFNFTKNAEESNAENLLIIRDKAVAAKYTANWQAHAGHSESYEGRESRSDASPAQPRSQPAARATSHASGYVASKNSEVFHRSDCKSAAKISEKNLVRYSTRDQVIQAGKKPCHECNP